VQVIHFENETLISSWYTPAVQSARKAGKHILQISGPKRMATHILPQPSGRTRFYLPFPTISWTRVEAKGARSHLRKDPTIHISSQRLEPEAGDYTCI
jgi:hypothetical protein